MVGSPATALVSGRRHLLVATGSMVVWFVQINWNFPMGVASRSV